MQNLGCIMADNTHVAQFELLDFQQQMPDSGAMNLYADIVDVRSVLRIVGKRLTVSKTNLDNKRVIVVKQIPQI